MKHTRGLNWLTRLTAVAGLILFGAILLGAQPGAAAPTAPVDPTEITLPGPPPPPSPHVNPTIKPTVVDLGTLEPCWQKDTCTPCPKAVTCQPPSSDPSTPPSSEPTHPPTRTLPTKPTRPTTPTRSTTTDPQTIPTPNRIETGGGATATTPNWLFLVRPGLAVLVMAGGIVGWRVLRTERAQR